MKLFVLKRQYSVISRSLHLSQGRHYEYQRFFFVDLCGKSSSVQNSLYMIFLFLTIFKSSKLSFSRFRYGTVCTLFVVFGSSALGTKMGTKSFVEQYRFRFGGRFFSVGIISYSTKCGLGVRLFRVNAAQKRAIINAG